jgi:tetratricopeptide (TPR) repeat protein
MDDHLKQLLLLGREHYQKREFDKAEYLLRQVVAKTDRFADVYDMLGVIAHGRGDFALAERHFEKAVGLNPNYTEAQLNLMVTYNDLGKYDAARRIYAAIRNRGAVGDVPADPFAKGKIANMHAETSQAYQDVGMLNEAVHELEKAVALCPDFADLRTRLGVLLRDRGERERARTEFEAAKQANPNYVQARVMLGVLLLSNHEPAKAIDEFEAVVLLDPENKSAQMYLRLARTALDKLKSSLPPAEEPPAEPPADPPTEGEPSPST